MILFRKDLSQCISTWQIEGLSNRKSVVSLNVLRLNRSKPPPADQLTCNNIRDRL